MVTSATVVRHYDKGKKAESGTPCEGAVGSDGGVLGASGAG